MISKKIIIYNIINDVTMPQQKRWERKCLWWIVSSWTSCWCWSCPSIVGLKQQCQRSLFNSKWSRFMNDEWFSANVCLFIPPYCNPKIKVTIDLNQTKSFFGVCTKYWNHIYIILKIYIFVLYTMLLMKKKHIHWVNSNSW